MGKPLRWPLGIEPEQLLLKTVITVKRRGKYLLVQLDQGVLLLHLGMSGSIRFDSEQPSRLPPLGPHDHFQLSTSKGILRLNDPRRFGAVVYASSLQAPIAKKLLDKLGVEPLQDGFTLAQFYAGLQKRKTSIKTALLAGDIVVGVGNIYASEALFLAGIRPTTRADRISRPRAEKLRLAVMDVLARAVKKGGSTLRDFSAADGKNGYFQLEAHVYDRVGEPCRLCGTTIRRIQQGQRSTYFCPVCQKP
jgi:formamidopyrimidine-DNA glycosylase